MRQRRRHGALLVSGNTARFEMHQVALDAGRPIRQAKGRPARRRWPPGERAREGAKGGEPQDINNRERNVRSGTLRTLKGSARFRRMHSLPRTMDVEALLRHPHDRGHGNARGGIFWVAAGADTAMLAKLIEVPRCDCTDYHAGTPILNYYTR